MKKATVLVVAMVLGGAMSQAKEPERESLCPKHAGHRSTLEVFESHVAALATANAERVACDYADDAYVILPNSVARGVKEITAAFGQFLSLLGPNAALQPLTLTVEGEVVLLEWRVEGERVIIGDGVDTLIVRDGLIVAQTVRLGDLSPR